MIVAQFFSWNRNLCVLVAAIMFVNLGSTGSADENLNFSETERNHWAFQPVVRPTVPPAPENSDSLRRNELDSFILAAMQKRGEKQASVVDRLTLLRRLTFDLIGLPPTLVEASEFLADDSPDAYERLVDRLLVSPHYGEAWGRMWLDAVRFAETAGFNHDPARPFAYKYRDYVIRALNRDLPFDRFLQEQLAGDELFPDDIDALTATGYCRMWADESNASNIHLARQLALDDLTGNLGAVVLGLSIGCAQCHDHKFDPLRQKDFYQLQAYFSGIVLEDQMPIGTHDQLTEFHGQRQDWLNQTSELRHELQAVEHEGRLKQAGYRRMKFPSDVIAAIDCLPEERTTMQRQLAFWSERQMEYKDDELPKHLSDEAKSRRSELLKQLAAAKQNHPKPPLEANLMAVAELSQLPPKTFLLANGTYDKPLEEVSPHVPAILRTNETRDPTTFAPPSDRSSGRRSALARWLTSSSHPLTHRVWVNRIWQGHFGRGLVENANDFGVLTPRPTQLELLDWLTSEFIASGFSTKRLHRLIVLSATYQQRGPGESDSAYPVVDYSHFPRTRLSSERIRDSWLAASGLLNDTMYGPGVRPELPPNFAGAANWKVSDPQERTRRSVYIYAKRNLPYPMMAAFDFPDMHESCGCRTSTTIAPQALMLLNNDLIVSAARQLSRRTIDEANSASIEGRIELAWQIVFGRRPSTRESDIAMQFISSQTTSDAEEAFVDFCHALFNANEFLFVE